jgi:hypothetical protein
MGKGVTKDGEQSHPLLGRGRGVGKLGPTIFKFEVSK